MIGPLAKAGWRALVATGRTSRERGAEELISLLSRVGVELQDLDADSNSAEDIADYVRALEETRDTTDLPEASGDAIAREFERYLKRRDGEDE